MDMEKQQEQNENILLQPWRRMPTPAVRKPRRRVQNDRVKTGVSPYGVMIMGIPSIFFRLSNEPEYDRDENKGKSPISAAMGRTHAEKTFDPKSLRDFSLRA